MRKFLLLFILVLSYVAVNSQPSISAISVTSAGAGATISITGANFSGAIAVSFGGTPATSFSVTSSSNILAIVGSGSSGNVSVTTAGGTTAFSGFSFITAPAISSVTPLTGTTGTTLTISGTDLSGASSVFLGGVSTPFTVLSPTTVTVTVGSEGASGNVSLQTPGGLSSFSGFTYIAGPPTIVSISPLSGTTGTVMTVTGTNLLGATAVQVGGVPVASYTVFSSTNLTAVVAGGATGSISVTTPQGTVVFGSFTYVVTPAPTIASFTPLTGTTGTIVIITGTNFTGATLIKFGATAASSFTVLSSTTITATIGLGSSGAISVTTAGGTVGLSGFTFVATAPSIASFAPTSAVAGTTVSISGTGFAGTTAVSFGGTSASSFTIVSSNLIKAVVATGATGSISITGAGGQATLSGFTFITAPSITSFTPLSALPAASIVITGTGFNTTAGNNIVFFGATRATVTVASATSLTVTVPAGATFAQITVFNTATLRSAASSANFIPLFTPSKGSIVASDFADKVAVASGGNNPTNVLTGDLDGDGKADMVVINSDNSNIAFFLNTSTGSTISFASPVIISSGTNPFAGALGDLDGDGKLDLVVTELNSDNINILLNKSSTGTIVMGPSSYGSGPFTGNFFVGTGLRPVGVTIADIDRDGKADLAVTNTNSNTITIFLNTGTPGAQLSFAAAATMSTGSVTGPFNIQVGDLDNDGNPDIAVSYQFTNTYISVFRNTSTPGLISFATRADLAAGTAPWGIALADLNGDGKLDITTANYTSSTISTYRNTSSVGTISFAAKVDISIVNPSYTFAIADMDGDGKPDLAFTNYTATSLSVLHNSSTLSGTISFDPAVSIPAGNFPGAVTAADFNNDGKPDLVAVNRLPGDNNISIFKNQAEFAPTITSFDPANATTGGFVTVTGTNLSNPTGVSIGGLAAASFTVLSPTALRAVVGAGASGSISITTNNGTAVLGGFVFTTPPPSIISFSPTSGPIGTIVKILVKGASSSNTFVFFGSARSYNAGRVGDTITAVVPIGATYEPITLATYQSKWLTAQSSKYFTVTSNSTPIDNNFFTKSDNTIPVNTRYMFRKDFNDDEKPDLVTIPNGSASSISVYKNRSTPHSIQWQPKLELQTGTTPTDVAIGDIDGDWRSDIVVANHGSNTVSVLKNDSQTGSGDDKLKFLTKIDYALTPPDILDGNIPGIATVTTADLNKDGKLDIVACSGGNSPVFSVFRNTRTLSGDSTTVPVFNISAEKIDIGSAAGTNRVYNPVKIIAADINNDGYTDLIFANAGTNGNASVSVFMNTSNVYGGISFDSAQQYAIGNTIGTMTVGDVDGDGKLDIIVSLTLDTQQVFVLRNTSTGTTGSFAAKQLLFAKKVYGMFMENIDGDGKPDLGIAEFTSTGGISVYKNTSTSPGNISFSSANTFPAGSVLATNIISGDFDNDGVNDIAVNADNSIVFFTGKPLPSGIPFIKSFLPASGPIGSTVVITGRNFDTSAKNNIVYFGPVKAIVKSGTDSSLTVTVPAGANYQPVSVTANNRTAYSIKPFSVTFPVTETLSDKTFGAKKQFEVGGIYATNIRTGDIDGDGKADYVVANYGDKKITISLNNGTRGSISFNATKTDLTLEGKPVDVALADIDGDGKLDIIAVNELPKTISVFRNTSSAGSVSFAAKVDFAAGMYPQMIATGDLDGDGKPEIVITNNQDGKMSVFKNKTTGTTISFAAKVDYTTGTSPQGIVIADIDGDLNPDVCVSSMYSNAVSIFRFTSVTGDYILFDQSVTIQVPTGGEPYNLAITDLDGDGKADMVTTNLRTNDISILRNTSTVGSISFSAKSDIPVTVSPNNISVGDVNGDGKPDIAVSSSDTAAYIMLNQSTAGNISFSAKTGFSVQGSSTAIILSDFDNDGKPDLGVLTSSKVSFFRNRFMDPVLTAFGTTAGGQGTAVTITGHNLSTTSSVTFGGTAASFSITSDSTLTAIVGNGNTGYVAVITQYGKDSLPGFNFVGGLKPVITAFGPTAAGLGASITITGHNFSTATIVTFGGTAATFTITTDSTMTAKVGNGSTGYVAITNLYGKDSLGVFTFTTLSGTTVTPAPKIISFTPQTTGGSSKVAITGSNFINVSAVSFGGTTALSFTVVTDSLITAVTGNGSSGYVAVTTPSGKDSLAGFVFGSPEIVLPDATKNSITFGALTGASSRSEYFIVTGKRLVSGITVTAPDKFLVSLNPDAGFGTSVSLSPVNNTIDSTKIYVRFKTDVAGTFSGTIVITATNAVSRSISVTGGICDAVINSTATITGITTDSTICTKSQVVFSAGTTNNVYKWSTGATTSSVIVENTAAVSLQVGSSAGCLSNPSMTVKVVKNTNVVPTLALSGDTKLVSSSASNYRWLYNNAILPNESGSSMNATKVGFYRVETSQEKICWDASNEFPIIFLSTPLVNDTVKVNAYPNPATGGTFTVVAAFRRATNVVVRVTVTTATGTVVLQTNKFIFFGREIKIPLTVSVKGTLFVKIDINGDVQTQTVIIP